MLSEKQSSTAERFQEIPSAIAWWKPGEGKTRLALWMFNQSQYRTLVVVTRPIVFDDWKAEIRACGFLWSVYLYKEKIPKQHPIRKVILLSADSIHKLKEVTYTQSMLVIDELYMFSNPMAKRSRELRKVSRSFGKCLGLSGSIMPSKNNETIYGQLWVMGLDTLVANNLTDFRSKYRESSLCTLGFKQFTNKKGSEDAILSKVKEYVDVHFPSGHTRNIQIVRLQKTPAQRQAIETLKNEYRLGEIEFKYALQVYHAVNAVSNGWKFESNKIKKCVALVEELLAQNLPVVIWCAYREDLYALSKVLVKIPHLVWSSDNPFDKVKWEKGTHKVVIATEGMGSSVNFFAQVEYAIYFSVNYKLLDLQQSMGRHERKSSKHAQAYYYVLQVEGSFDAHTWNEVNKSEKTEKQFIQSCMELLS